MDLSTVLQEVGSWPAEERMHLVEAVWDDLIAGGAEPELTDVQRAELDRRVAALEANPEDVVSWETVQQFIRRPR